MHSRQIWVQKDKSSPQSPSGQSQRTVPWAPNRVLRPGPLGRSYGVGMALPECQDPIMLAPLCRWELECRQGAWCSTWSRAHLKHLGFVIPPKQQFPKCGPGTSSINITGELVINADSKAWPPQACWVRSSGCGSHLILKSLPVQI